jgi:hypothetical protein
MERRLEASEPFRDRREVDRSLSRWSVSRRVRREALRLINGSVSGLELEGKGKLEVDSSIRGVLHIHQVCGGSPSGGTHSAERVVSFDLKRTVPESCQFVLSNESYLLE